MSAGQGHVIMDVANRLCPEVGLVDMLGEVKRAVAWVKANGGQYGVDPKRIVLAGSSSAARLPLLAAYIPGLSALTPAELRDVDLSVRGVGALGDAQAWCGASRPLVVVAHGGRNGHLSQSLAPHVDMHGNTFVASLENQANRTCDRQSLHRGNFGLWTKSGSETCFDDVTLMNG